VESSAGTGKTFLLEHLFVDLILTHGLGCEEILVVTFTEKATAELVIRLRALIARLADLHADDPKAIEATRAPASASWLIDDKAKKLLAEALLAFDRASIFTIHGFCQRVLREHAFVQGRFFDEELIGEEAAFGHAFHEVLRTDVAKDSDLAAGIEGWLTSGRSIAALEKLLRDCDAEKTTPLRTHFDQARLVAAMAAWRPIVAEDEELKRRLKLAKVKHPSIKSVVARLARASEIVAACAENPVRLLAAAMQKFASERRMQDGLAFVLERLPAAPADASLAVLAASVRELKEAIVPLEAYLAERLSPIIRERAAGRKRKAGLFDFSDMLYLVAKALADPGPAGDELLQALRRRYRHALIDEFQDTDETQWSIFRRIFVESPGEHALTVIGDPKQAIYGFRGADVHAYLKASLALQAAGASLLVLDRNFRSTADMVEATNLIFDQSAEFFWRDSGITYDRPVRCGRSDLRLLDESPAMAAPVVVFDVASASANANEGQPVRAPTARATVQTAIVEELRVLLDPASPLRLRGNWDGDRRLRARDVFILTFTNAESHAIGRALADASIPFAFYKLGNLFESSEAAEVLVVLRAVANPEDRSLRARALLTGFFDLDVTGAAACLDLGQAAEPVRLLHRFADLARKGDVPALFASMIDDSGIVRREVFAHTSERTLTNITHVLEVLQAEWARSHASLPELADVLDAFVRGTQKPPSREGDLQRLETDKDAVQILTVHKAKGLEADIVFVYGGTGERTSGSPVHVLHEGGQRVLHVGRLDATAERLYDRETEDERSRLLYVALTRARYRLYLPHYPRELRSLKGPYRRANQRLDDILGQRHERACRHFSVRICPIDPLRGRAVVLAGAALQAALLPQAFASAREPDDLVAIKAQRSGFAVTSYTAVKHARGEFTAVETDPRLASELALGNGNDEGNREADNEELPGGAETGIFLHDILATVALADLASTPNFADWYARPSVARLLEKMGKRHARPAAHVPLAARLVHRAYTAPVRLAGSVIAGLASAPVALREVEFLFPIPESSHPLLSRPQAGTWTVERGVVKGFVDLLFEHDGRVFVCDWKSDPLPRFDGDTLARHCQQNYDVQARIYTIAALRLCGIRTPTDYGRRFGGVVFCFLRGLGSRREADNSDADKSADDSVGIHFLQPTWDDILSWEADMLGQQFWGLSR
jgi:exodeoxyribonuclease V beta subunit